MSGAPVCLDLNHDGVRDEKSQTERSEVRIIIGPRHGHEQPGRQRSKVWGGGDIDDSRHTVAGEFTRLKGVSK